MATPKNGPSYWPWALGALAFTATILLALRLMWVVVVLPEDGTVWGPSSRWGHLGAALEGVGTLALALGAIISAIFALHQWTTQRRRELSLRERQNDLDVAKLQGEVVTALRLRYKHADQARQPALKAQLDKELARYEEISRGVIRARPELTRALREALVASLNAATAELDRLRGQARNQP